jgi:hypothetical protein
VADTLVFASRGSAAVKSPEVARGADAPVGKTGNRLMVVTIETVEAALSSEIARVNAMREQLRERSKDNMRGADAEC